MNLPKLYLTPHDHALDTWGLYWVVVRDPLVQLSWGYPIFGRFQTTSKPAASGKSLLGKGRVCDGILLALIAASDPCAKLVRAIVKRRPKGKHAKDPTQSCSWSWTSLICFYAHVNRIAKDHEYSIELELLPAL